MSARDVVCDALNYGERYAPEDWIPLATDVLAALKKAGFAVVELPASPDHINEATEDEHGWRTWFTEYGTVQVSDSGCVAIDRIYRFSDLPEEPAHLRSLAAALLAAADVAEAVK